MHLLTPHDLDAIFSSYFLLNQNSFFVIDSATKTYQENRLYSSLAEYAQYIKSMYASGSTIIVKNLENFNEAIKAESLKYGLDINVHMYLVPPGGGDSFDFHVDDRDVNVLMVYGEKIFEVKRAEATIEKIHLKAGDSLFIKKGEEHRALPMGGSCLLSFGSSPREEYFVPGGLEQKDISF